MSHRIKTSKKKYLALGTAGLVLVGAGAAYAYFSSTGSGTGSSTSGTSSLFQIDVASTNLSDLTPGGPIKTVNFTVTNTGTGVQRLNAVAASVTGTSNAGCTAADFAVGSASISYGDMAAGSVLPGTFTLQMINRTGVNQDACQGVTVNLKVGDPVVGSTPMQLSVVRSGFSNPVGVAVDPSGNVYVADFAAQVVKKVTPGGTVTTVAGTGTAGNSSTGVATTSQLNNPWGVALDSAGNLYIASLSGARVQKVTPGGAISLYAGTGTSGQPTNGPATSSNLGSPAHIAIDRSDNLYIADQGANRIEKVTPAGTLSIIAGNGSQGGSVGGPALNSALNQPQGVDVDRAGNVYIADTSGHRVEKVTPAGVLSPFAGTGSAGNTSTGVATTSQLAGPADVRVDDQGNVFIANNGPNNMMVVTPSGQIYKVAGTGASGQNAVAGPALSSPLSGPHQLALGTDGDIYVTASGTGQIVKLAY